MVGGRKKKKTAFLTMKKTLRRVPLGCFVWLYAAAAKKYVCIIIIIIDIIMVIINEEIC